MSVPHIIIALDIIAFCAAVVMTYEAWRAHRVLQSNTSVAFLTCFALISIGLAARTVTDMVADITFLLTGFVTGMHALPLTPRVFLIMSSVTILAGYTLLLMIVERITNRAVWVLVPSLIGITLFLARDMFLITHILAIVLLGLLAHRFYSNFLAQGTTNTLLVYLSFLSLMFAHVAALLIPFSNIPHLIFLALRVLGYFGLFTVFWRVTH